MVRNLAWVAFFCLGIGWPNPAAAQQATPAGDSPKEPTTLRERIKEPDQGGGLHITEHLAVVFGGIKTGSRLAAGPAISHKFQDGGYAQVKAEYSIRRFRLLQARYDTRSFWHGRAGVVSRLRWQDAPQLTLFSLGADAPNLSALYSERKTESSARLRVQITPALRLASGFGIERYATSAGAIDVADDEHLGFIPAMPGLGTRPWFGHTFASLAVDSRLSPEYSRSGRLLEAAVHDYRDWHDGQDSFRRVELIAQQLVPTHGGKGVIDVSAQAWLSHSKGSRAVPFFLMPTLGGSIYLPAYQAYRFRERNALAVKGEYRWAVHPMIDVAGVYAIGSVAPSVKGLGLSQAATSIGGGLRLHTKTSGLVNLDLAHGRDGLRLGISLSVGGS